MLLTNGSMGFNVWKEIKTLTLKIYLFDIQNSQELVDGTADQIVVKEIGPYIFRAKYDRNGIEFLDNATAIRYFENQTFYFDREASAGNLTDQVTMINVPAVVSILLCCKLPLLISNRLMDSIFKQSMDQFMRNKHPEADPFLKPFYDGEISKIFMTYTLQDILFDGYPLTFLDEMRKAYPDIPEKFAFLLDVSRPISCQQKTPQRHVNRTHYRETQHPKAL